MIRVTRFHAVNFRSLGDVRLDALPEVVLLYGDNDVGKSNILRAVGAWLKLVGFALRIDSGAFRLDADGTRSFLLDRETAGRILGRPVESQFRQEQVQMQLEGGLRISSPEANGASEWDLGFSFQLTLVDDVDGTVVAATLQTVEWAQTGVLRASVPASDRTLIALRAALSDPWLWISSERRFHPELAQEGMGTAEAAPSTDDGGDQAAAPNGRGLLRWLFRAHVGTDRALRQAFDKRFLRLLTSGPFPLDAPRPVLDEHGFLDLWVGDRSIRDHGSGPRQWALIAGMTAMSEASIVGLEEPEANLSWGARLAIAQRLVAEVRDTRTPPHQMFITSHDGSMYEASDEKGWYLVTRIDGATQVTRQTSTKGLDALAVKLSDAPSALPGSMRLYPGGAVALPEEIVRHLGAEIGSFLYPFLDQPGEVRLVGEDRFEEIEQAARDAGQAREAK